MFFLYMLCSTFSFFNIIFFEGKLSYINITKITLSPSLLFILILLGLASLSNQIFRGIAYKSIKSPSTLAPFIYLSIIISLILDMFYFGINPHLKDLIGAFLIVLGSYLTVIKNFKLAKFVKRIGFSLSLVKKPTLDTFSSTVSKIDYLKE